MTRATRRAVLTLVVGLAGAAPAWADLVYFANGRTMSVKASRIEGESLVLTLRGGGEASFERGLVARIEPDEIPYPEPLEEGVDISTRLESGVTGRPSSLSLSRYEPIIQRMSAVHGVDPVLIRAMIQVESAYQPRARSPKGAVGLMQVMPATGRQYGITNLWDPASNIEAGTTHLRSLLDRLPLSLALAAYNAGESAVLRFSGIPPYPETRTYVSRILKLVGH
ncbi:MAG: transglycosylase SLT domain-containing protein [Luteitalea sp.]|nr:transglycosylase SLT domain-containing protein [Luteitalea sp.]